MLSRRWLLVASVVLVAVFGAGTGLGASTAPASTGGATWYVSGNGNNQDGTSWTTAWNDFSDINWSRIHSGDTVVVDGGATECTPVYEFTGTRPGVSCGMEYASTLNVRVSGVTIELSTASGRNGTAVIFGGRSTPLPYCHQTGYSAGAGNAAGVEVNGYDHVTIDGSHISGFMVYGNQTGVQVQNSAGSNLFEHMEVFDNGIWNGSKGGGVISDDPGFWLGASPNTTLRGDIVHDNGQDEIQDATRPNNSLNGLTLDTDWLFATRENPAQPGEPFNDLQAVGDNTCEHSDGIQLWSGGKSQSGLTVEHSIIGPLTNQGLYPSEGGRAKWNNVSVTDSLFLAVKHNIITSGKVSGWTLDHDTLFAEQGGFELPSKGPNTITNVVKYGGYVFTPRWSSRRSSGTTTGNVWYLGQPLPGISSNQNLSFVGPVPSGALNGFSAYAAANFTPQCAGCQGSSLHTLSDIVSRIESLSP